ncbi:hypothetical protein SSS_03625 [Sarcoptes scabiei]|uniref:Uncharacterized protein n=1 Tax=Sarcoptes scabiei TaxID=52283 RepID=A0A834R3U4_SARSC|nr:hypothetical protein SSS_03625 [Sarcoptes scabiei]
MGSLAGEDRQRLCHLLQAYRNDPLETISYEDLHHFLRSSKHLSEYPDPEELVNLFKMNLKHKNGGSSGGSSHSTNNNIKNNNASNNRSPNNDNEENGEDDDVIGLEDFNSIDDVIIDINGSGGGRGKASSFNAIGSNNSFGDYVDENKIGQSLSIHQHHLNRTKRSLDHLRRYKMNSENVSMSSDFSSHSSSLSNRSSSSPSSSSLNRNHHQQSLLLDRHRRFRFEAADIDEMVNDDVDRFKRHLNLVDDQLDRLPNDIDPDPTTDFAKSIKNLPLKPKNALESVNKDSNALISRYAQRRRTQLTSPTTIRQRISNQIFNIDDVDRSIVDEDDDIVLPMDSSMRPPSSSSPYSSLSFRSNVRLANKMANLNAKQWSNYLLPEEIERFEINDDLKKKFELIRQIQMK